MKAWRFYRGEWSEVDDPTDGIDIDFEEEMAKLGYSRSQLWDEGYCAPTVDVYEKAESEWLLMVNPAGDKCHTVIIDDLPSLLEFLARYSPQIVLASIDFRLSCLEEAVDKAFYAWHGHSPRRACASCDRDFTDRRRKRLTPA